MRTFDLHARHRGGRVLSAATLVVSAALTANIAAGRGQSARPNPLAFFSPEKRAEIVRGAPVVEVLHEHGDDFAVAGAVMTTAAPARLVAWSREIAALQRGGYIPVIQRFSSNPAIEDLASLTLDEGDLDDLEDCRPGRCGLKLSAPEIDQMRKAIDGAGSRWRSAALDAFRSIMLARVGMFQEHGFNRVLPYEDEERRVDPAAEFEAVVAGLSGQDLLTPRVEKYLLGLPATSAEAESFFYWSKDLLGDAKPIISITHLSILHGTDDEPTIVVAVQVFATHYVNASVSLTAVLECGASRGHLVYLRRSRVDVFHGAFGGLVRHMVNKRVRAEGRSVLNAFRLKLEGSLPPFTTRPGGAKGR